MQNTITADSKKQLNVLKCEYSEYIYCA